MATTVPYNPIPSVAPQDRPIRPERIDTPIAAFGGTIAAATSHLGEAVSGAGNEIFARGLAMQDLYNHSQAIQADTEFMKSAGDVHARLSAMQGKDAVEYYQNGYQKDLDDARQSIRDGLPNDMSRKLFDQSSLSTVGRTIFNGAGHAATENKQYAIGAAGARVKESQNAALANPTDEEGFQQHIQDVTDNTKQQWQLKGADPDTINAATHKAVSDTYINRITGLAKTQPFQANKVLNDAASKGLIEGSDLGRITGVVQSSTHTVGARNLSAETRSGADLSQGAGIIPIDRAKIGITGPENSGKANYEIPGPMVPGKGQALGRYQVMPKNLAPWLKEAGLPSMTPEEFLKSPSAQDKVFETVFGRYMNETKSFNEAASMWFTGKTIAEAGGVTDKTPTTAGHNVPWYLAKANAALAQSATLSEQVVRVRARAADLAPDDPLMADFAADRVRADHAKAQQDIRATEYDYRNTIDDSIIKGNNGVPFTNVDEMIHANPQAEAAYLGLPQVKQLQVQKDVISYNNAITKQTNQAAANTLRGLQYGDPEDVQKFINTNIYQQPLNRGDMNKFLSDQRKMIKDQGGDVQIRQALKMVEPLISSENIDVKNKDLMARFRGAYIDAIQDWHGQNPNKPLDEKTAKGLAVGIMQQQTSPNFWFSRSTDNLFNLPLPSDIEEQLKKSNPNISASELEVYRQEFVRQQFNALQKSKAAPK